ncbi:MAG TPA: PA2169 family four-helix-bundle protein [Rudaea sp.]|nr:PA2169 family four-helix-bundle protein [Rudaea sp.]
MTRSAATLNDLIEIARDGLAFYTDAIANVKNPHLKDVFRSIVDAKQELIAELGDEVRARGALPSSDGTFVGGFRKLYADVRAKLASDKDATYIVELEQSEDRLLRAFEQAAKEAANDASLHRIVLKCLPHVRRCHERMRTLKISLAA